MRTRAIQPVEDPAASAELAALLRAYTQGGSTKFENRVRRRLKGKKGSKAAAERLLSRIEGAPAGKRRKRLGTSSMPRKASKASIARAVDNAAIHRGSLLFLLEAIELPPQGIPLPNTYRLEEAALVTKSTEDADGTDELTTFAIIARPVGTGYALETVELGADVSTSVGTRALSGTLYSGVSTDAVIVTALVEGDEGNAEEAKSEIELLVGLAASVAETMEGADRMGVLETMIDFTLTLDSVGSSPDRAARSVVVTPISKSEWAGLWAADAQGGGGVSYTVAIPHRMGTGEYELLLDVPGELPQMKTVRLTLSDLEHQAEFTDALSLDQINIGVAIGDEGYTFYGAPGDFRPVQRKVVAGDVQVRVTGQADYAYVYPQYILDRCASPNHSDQYCEGLKRKFRRKVGILPTKSLNLDGTREAYETTYSTTLGGFKPAADPKGKKGASTTAPQPSAPIRSRTAKGTQTPWAKVKITATSS